MNNKSAQAGEQSSQGRQERVGQMPPVGHARALVRNVTGVTLIELMAVLAVVVILASIAVPAIGTFVRNARMVTQANDFLADLAYARSEAIKRRGSVTLCKSNDTTASPPTCNAAGSNWGTGRLVFLDTDGDGALDAGEEILRVRGPLEGNNTLNGGTNVATSIVFRGTGITTLSAPASPGANAFALCDESGAARGRAIDVHFSGRPTLSRNPPSCSPPWP